ncbi:MAG: PKD domain-containing protein, partial [Cytophagales bacterium]|nr:PKD domain-containing protein [Cytophagales bacterium]
MGWSQWEAANWYFLGGRQTNIYRSDIVNFHFDSNGLTYKPTSIGTPTILSNGYNITTSISSPNGKMQFAVVRADSLVNGGFYYIRSQSGDFNSYSVSAGTSIFIPLKGMPSKQYLYFYMKRTDNIGFPYFTTRSLKYALLDSSLYGGNGGAYFSNRIAPFQKDSNNFYPHSLSAAMHKNGRDVWLVMKDYYHDFYSIRLGPCGEMSSMIYNKNPRRIDKLNYTSTNVTTMEFNPTSSHFAVLDDSLVNLYLYSFNNETGKVNFVQLLDSNIFTQENKAYPGIKILSFSPDGRYLYRVSNRNYPHGYIYQYDLKPTFDNPGTKPTRSQSYPIAVPAAIHPGLDGKIYLFYNSSFVTRVGHVGVIGNPNQQYPLNQLDTAAITVQNGLNLDGYSCFPNFVNDFRWPGWKGIQLHIANFTTTSLCINTPISFSPIDTTFAQKVTWDFGDGTLDTAYFPNHVYNDTGIYQVKMRLHLSCYTDSITKSLHVTRYQKPDFGKDTSLYCYDNFRLDGGEIVGRYNWSNGDTMRFQMVTTPGMYWVITSNNCGSGSDTIKVTWKTPDYPQVKYRPQLISILDSCVSNPVRFALTDTTGVKKVVWDFGDGNGKNSFTPAHTYEKQGVYQIHVKAQQLCYIDSSARAITIDPVPIVALGADT